VWRMPPAPFGQPGEPMDVINYRARYGTPNTKWMTEFVPFDHTDMSTHMTAAFANMRHSTADRDPGSGDIKLQNFFIRNGAYSSKALTPLQEEAMAYRFGWIGIVLRGVETLMRRGYIQPGAGYVGDGSLEAQAAAFARELASGHPGVASPASPAGGIGLWSTDINHHVIQHEILADVMMNNIVLGDDKRANAERIFMTHHAGKKTWNQMSSSQLSEHDDLYRLLMTNLVTVAITGITDTWYSATNKIIGRPMNSADSTQTMHMLLGHFVL